MAKSNELNTFLFTDKEDNFKERTGKDFTFFYNKYYPKLLYFTSRMAEEYNATSHKK
jgi:hypothetical protein